MLKVAINITPLRSAHKNRGIGFYTKNLIESLRNIESLELQTFMHMNEIKDVDVIHYPWFDFFFHTLPIIKKVPTVVTIHDVIPLIFKENYPAGLKGQLNFFLQRMALKSCKSFITDSNASKKDIIDFLKINEDKVKTIALAADKDFKQISTNKQLLIKRKHALSDRFILYTGDANWVKNLPFLLQAFKLLKENPSFFDVKLILIGGVFLKKLDNINHPELESLKKFNEMIVEFNLDREIIRLGDIDKEILVGIYNLATVYVQPSLYEGFGLPILEAMSCGTPVVCSKAGSLPEIGGNAALYFDPQKVNQLVGLLSDVIEDRSLRIRLSKLGLSQANKYSWEETANETAKVYFSLKA